jgi:hypothetical protein
MSRHIEPAERPAPDKSYRRAGGKPYAVEYRVKPEYAAKDPPFVGFFKLDWTVDRLRRYATAQERDQALAVLQHKSATSTCGIERFCEYRAGTP